MVGPPCNRRCGYKESMNDAKSSASGRPSLSGSLLSDDIDAAWGDDLDAGLRSNANAPKATQAKAAKRSDKKPLASKPPGSERMAAGQPQLNSAQAKSTLSKPPPSKTGLSKPPPSKAALSKPPPSKVPASKPAHSKPPLSHSRTPTKSSTSVPRASRAPLGVRSRSGAASKPIASARPSRPRSLNPPPISRPPGAHQKVSSPHAARPSTPVRSGSGESDDALVFSAAQFKKPELAKPKVLALGSVPRAAKVPEDLGARSAKASSPPPESVPEQISENEISDAAPEAQSRNASDAAAPAAGERTLSPASPSGAPEAKKPMVNREPQDPTLDDAPTTESSAVGASVSDVDVETALRQARRGRSAQIAITVAAAAVILVGAGLGMHQQAGPDVQSSKADPGNLAAPTPAPAAISTPAPTETAAADAPVAPSPPEPEPEPVPLKSVIVRAHPLGAQIFDGSKKIAHTAVTLELAPDEKRTLTFYLDGYRPRQVIVNAAAPEVNVAMKPVVAAEAAEAAPTAQKANETDLSATNEPKKARSSTAPSPEDEILPAL